MAERLNLHEAVGGTDVWRKLSTAFYSRVARDPRLKPLFPGKTLHCAIEELTAFLVQLFGGPSDDTQRRWWLSLRDSHQRFRIRQEDRAAWMENMVAALDEMRLDEPLRSALQGFFEKSSAHVVNSGEPVPPDSGAPHDGAIRTEIAHCWEGQRALDDAVAAIRTGDAAHAVELAARLHLDRSVLAGLLGMMMGTRNAILLSYVRKQIVDDPLLIHERYAGRTLLHAASGQGNLAMVELLLRLGADAGAKDGGDHTPLYSVANECGASDGVAIVRALINAGADVNACDGVTRATALHMAARRGNVDIAEALLDCGADADAPDYRGNTPLRRALNCRKANVADLLVKRQPG